MSNYFDFNNASLQQSFDLIPKNTISRVRMTLRPGGYDDAAQGWTGGYATQSESTGSVYLSAEFVVLEGPFARRKLWANIGLYSPKGSTWGDMGKSFIRAALNSARNVAPKDDSPGAMASRRIASFAELDGLEFVVKIDQEKDQQGGFKNTIHHVIEPGHAAYLAPTAGGVVAASTQVPPTAGAMTVASHAMPAARPAWAQ